MGTQRFRGDLVNEQQQIGKNNPYFKEMTMHPEYFAHSRLPTSAVESGG